jgi:hypothetical protein
MLGLCLSVAPLLLLVGYFTGPIEVSRSLMYLAGVVAFLEFLAFPFLARGVLRARISLDDQDPTSLRTLKRKVASLLNAGSLVACAGWIFQVSGEKATAWALYAAAFAMSYGSAMLVWKRRMM